MIRPGLVSVSFRKLSPRELLELAVKNGLTGIEWGGDVHVPGGDLRRAKEVRAMTRDAGLEVACYGSYYRTGLPDSEPAGVIETAVQLGAPMIRVWAGAKGSEAANLDDFSAAAKDLRRFAVQAKQAGIAVTVEFHPDTLADTAASAMRLLSEAGETNLGINWQPDPRDCHQARLASLSDVLPKLTNLHVFNWIRDGETTARRPLAEAGPDWTSYLRTAAGDRFALLEFMPNDLADELPGEAAALRQWLATLPVSSLSP